MSRYYPKWNTERVENQDRKKIPRTAGTISHGQYIRIPKVEEEKNRVEEIFDYIIAGNLMKIMK